MKMIVACDDLGGIGLKGDLPWKIPADLRHFREMTLHQVVVTGRKTFNSIDAILPDRYMVVLTKNPQKFIHKLSFHVDDTSKLKAVTLPELNTLMDRQEAIVIGGADVYSLLFDQCDEIIMTRVPGDYKCDTFFPVEKLDNELFDCSMLKTLDTADGELTVFSYKRK